MQRHSTIPWLLVFPFLCACTGSVGGGGGAPAVDGPPGPCTGDGTRCVGTTFQRCVGGTYEDEAHCTGGSVCKLDQGCLACDPAIGRACVGDEVHECTADGQVGDYISTCSLESCNNGRCSDPCGDAEASRSYIGCEYWPVDLHNAVEVYADDYMGCASVDGAKPAMLKVCYDATQPSPPGTPFIGGQCDYGDDCSATGGGARCVPMAVCAYDAQHSPFAVVVANPSATSDVSVTLENEAGMKETVTVAPGEVSAVFPQELGFPDQSIPNGGIYPNAYHLTSSLPIVAYQFNPLDNVGVFSNDASLLLPAHAFDTQYYGLTLPTLTRRPLQHDYSGYLTVVASAPGTTNITVTATTSVRAGASMAAFGPGAARTFPLEQWQTLTLEAVADGDLSGTQVTSDGNPFGMFAGHVAALASDSGMSCCADHLEDQAFPASTWGKVYAIARTQPRRGEPDWLRIMAQRPGTTVTINPPSGSCPTLPAGGFCQVRITGDTEVSANEPIQVGHFMLSVGQYGDVGNPPGDPSLSFAVPTEQFRLDYSLLVPMQYETNFLALVAPVGGNVALDDQDVTAQLAPFGSGTYRAGRIAVAAGAHRLRCPSGCGVEVGGYSGAVSYLFAGGLDLAQIVVE